MDLPWGVGRFYLHLLHTGSRGQTRSLSGGRRGHAARIPREEVRYWFTFSRLNSYHLLSSWLLGQLLIYLMLLVSKVLYLFASPTLLGRFAKTIMGIREPSTPYRSWQVPITGRLFRRPIWGKASIPLLTRLPCADKLASGQTPPNPGRRWQLTLAMPSEWL